jgi:hypothetical protein
MKKFIKTIITIMAKNLGKTFHRIFKLKQLKIKHDNITQIDIMKEAGIPKEEMPDYALSSIADGALLRSYLNEVKSGEITEKDAVKRVKHDFEKMKSGEKEGKFIEP